jgi:hypothetical protein
MVLSVSREESSVGHIDFGSLGDPDWVYMTKAPSTTLVLGGTGKIGSRLAVKLAKLGLDVRTAAPKGADTEFDWNDATTHPAAV